MANEGRLERVLRSGAFAVTAETVPPKGSDPEPLRAQARGLVGRVDAANVTDNPTSSAHMSPVAGAAVIAGEGLEPVLQLTVRDRNRLALTGDLLGGWAVGARAVLCLSGDPVASGDHPDAVEVFDLDVLSLIRLAVRFRDRGELLSGERIEAAPGYLVGVADLPLAPSYDPARLEAKADAGADFVQTQICYDVDALGEWADAVRPRGVFERMHVLVGVAALRGPRMARYMRDGLPGVVVPDEVVARLEEAGEDAASEGTRIAVETVAGLRKIDGIGGVHVMGLGNEEAIRRVVEEAGLLPRPS